MPAHPDQMRGPERIGIMGGTFDPIHIGHLSCAEQARERLALDKVLFVPAENPSFKRDVRLAPAEQRLAMCELAVAGNPAFEVSDIEIGREGVTYTIDTVRLLKDQIADDASLAFIVGGDILESLGRWKAADELKGLLTFACVTRPGADRADAAAESLREAGFDIEVIEAPMLDVSSREIRQRIRDGLTVRYLVPDPVLEYIGENGLYARAR